MTAFRQIVPAFLLFIVTAGILIGMVNMQEHQAQVILKRIDRNQRVTICIGRILPSERTSFLISHCIKDPDFTLGVQP